MDIEGLCMILGMGSVLIVMPVLGWISGNFVFKGRNKNGKRAGRHPSPLLQEKDSIRRSTTGVGK